LAASCCWCTIGGFDALAVCPVARNVAVHAEAGYALIALTFVEGVSCCLSSSDVEDDVVVTVHLGGVLQSAENPRGQAMAASGYHDE